MKEKERIENRIRRGREDNGYKQSDLSFLLGNESSSQVSRYERGLIMPDPENMMKLCYIFKTLPEWLYPEITRRVYFPIPEFYLPIARVFLPIYLPSPVFIFHIK